MPARAHLFLPLISPTNPLQIAVFWSAQGQQLRYAGTTQAKDWKTTIIHGSPDDLKFVVYYVAEDKETILAVGSMQNDPLVAHASELFRLGKMIGAKEIEGGKVSCRSGLYGLRARLLTMFLTRRLMQSPLDVPLE